MLNLDNNLRIAIEASIKAGIAIMDIYDQEFTVEYKGDSSPLTMADISANKIINSYLNKTEIPIISEENRQIPFEKRKDWNRCWIVDPLDGTKEFVKRNGEFTVNIALIEKGKPIFGVIFAPATSLLYVGLVKEKASLKVIVEDYEKSVEDIINLLKPLNPKSLPNQVRIVGSRSHMNEKTKSFIEGFAGKGKKINIVSKGSSLKFCLVADGLADIYPRFAPTMEWDTAAGQAICNAVGVEVISQETNGPLRYNKENLLNPEFIVSLNNEKSS